MDMSGIDTRAVLVLIILLEYGNAHGDRCHRYDELLSTCKECQYGWYGPDCMFRCQNCWVSGCNNAGICDQCTPGRYGEDCGSLCPVNCGDSGYGHVFCRREGGVCLEGCNIGWWGDTCNRRCNQHCDETGCIQHTGHCIGDCKVGWWGLKCDRQCSDGCKHGCRGMTGQCQDGCKDGFTSRFCNEPCPGRCKKCHQTSRKCFKCPNLMFGNNCTRECGANCVDYLCNMQGRCTKGCIEGFRGSACNETCPVNCLTCGQDDNICINCKLGWTRSRCETRDMEVELNPIGPPGPSNEERESGQSAAYYMSKQLHVTCATLIANFILGRALL